MPESFSMRHECCAFHTCSFNHRVPKALTAMAIAITGHLGQTVNHNNSISTEQPALEPVTLTSNLSLASCDLAL